MIGRLNHVAIAVPSLESGVATYGGTLGAKCSEPQEVTEHGVKVVFVELPNTKIELLEQLAKTARSPSFLKRTLLAVFTMFATKLTISSLLVTNSKPKAHAFLATVSRKSVPMANLLSSCIRKISAEL